MNIGSKLAFGGLFLHLLILQSIHVNIVLGSSKHDVLRLHSMDSASSSHIMMDHMDPSSIVFFKLEDLKLGNKMPIFFPSRDLPSSSLSKEEADSIPFSLKHLPDLLKRFEFSHGSPQAVAMENTLRECDVKAVKGETKLCATSYESMFNFATRFLGSGPGFIPDINLISTVYITKPTDSVQEYVVIRDPVRVLVSKAVACHTMPYPYTVFYCHFQESENRVYKVSLAGQYDGNRVEALAVCHMDTSEWSPDHVSFRILGFGPGSGPVCHYFPADNFVLISITSASFVS